MLLIYIFSGIIYTIFIYFLGRYFGNKAGIDTGIKSFKDKFNNTILSKGLSSTDNFYLNYLDSHFKLDQLDEITRYNGKIIYCYKRDWTYLFPRFEARVSQIDLINSFIKQVKKMKDVHTDIFIVSFNYDQLTAYYGYTVRWELTPIYIDDLDYRRMISYGLSNYKRCDFKK